MALSEEEAAALREVFASWAKHDGPLVQLGTGDPTRPGSRVSVHQVEPTKMPEGKPVHNYENGVRS